MAKVLVTCVGSGVGQSVIDSLNLSGKHSILGCDTNRNVYAYQFCDEFHIVPSIYSAEYVDYLLDLCIQKDVDVIVPGHDYELLLLSKNIFKFEDQGITVIVSRPDIIEVSRDKYEWYNYFKQHGCAIVPTYKLKDFKNNPDPSLFPAIVKPSGGSASQGIYILNDISELNDLNVDNDSDIIQPYLFPEKDDPNYGAIKKEVSQGKFMQMSEISIQLVFTNESEFAGVFISKNALKSGVPIYVDPIDPDGFEYIDEIMKFVPICQNKKVKGPVNIQGRITENGLVFFEMNMRFTGITGNRALLGFNEVEFLVNNFRGLPARLNGYAKNKKGVRQVACTTIPRLDKIEKLTICLLGIENSFGNDLLDVLISENIFQKIFIICEENTYDEFLSTYSSDKIEIISDSDKFLETAYCQSDVLINFSGGIGNSSDEEIYQAILWKYNQLQKVIKSNIPLIINASSTFSSDQKNHSQIDEALTKKTGSTDRFQKDINEKFFESVEYFSPASKCIRIKVSEVIDQFSKNGGCVDLIKSVFNKQTIN